MPRALISVSDKRGILPFAEGLARLGWEIVSTGGTATLLREGGVAVTAVDAGDRFPRNARRARQDAAPAESTPAFSPAPIVPSTCGNSRNTEIARFDLVAVNLYPFQATIANPGVKFEDAIENIDVGGPAMLRSAAKNFEFVLPVVDPKDYPRIIDLLSHGRDRPGYPPRTGGQGVHAHR